VRVDLVGSGKQVDVESNALLECSLEGSQNYNDMVDMPVLNEPELLTNLMIRLKEKQIFTFVGFSLIVVNPYCTIESNFSP
jgi:myosin heavy subunit